MELGDRNFGDREFGDMEFGDMFSSMPPRSSRTEGFMCLSLSRQRHGGPLIYSQTGQTWKILTFKSSQQTPNFSLLQLLNQLCNLRVVSDVARSSRGYHSVKASPDQLLTFMHGCILKILDRLLALGMPPLSARARTVLTFQTCFPLWSDTVKGLMPQSHSSAFLSGLAPPCQGLEDLLPERSPVAREITCCKSDHLLPEIICCQKPSETFVQPCIPLPNQVFWLFL